MTTVDPLTAVGVLVATAATDAVYVQFTSAVVARKRLWAANWSSLRSAENYLGFERTENFASSADRVPDRQHVYTVHYNYQMKCTLSTGLNAKKIQAPASEHVSPWRPAESLVGSGN